jgi:hypothetical protein
MDIVPTVRPKYGDIAMTNGIPVYKVMTTRDTFDITLISVIDMLTQVLIERNAGNRYRQSRLETMYDKLHQAEKSYEGYIPDEYINRSEKFVKYIHNDLNSLLKDLPKERK